MTPNSMIWALLLVISSVYADSTSMRLVTSSLNVVELEKAKYQIGINKPSPVVAEADVSDVDKLSIRSANGVLYQCSIPYYKDDESGDGSSDRVSSTSNYNFTDIHLKVNKSMDYLKNEEVCIYKNLGWWTYEFCFGNSASQFHLLANGSIQGEKINLGYFQGESNWSEPSQMNQGSQVFYHEQFFDKGSMCELNQKPRKTVVKIYCGEGATNSIDEIAEIETCIYEMKIYSSLLCDITGFKKEQENYDVDCSPMLDQDGYERYVKYDSEMKERRRQRRQKAFGDQLFTKRINVETENEQESSQDSTTKPDEDSLKTIIAKTRDLFVERGKTRLDDEETDEAVEDQNQKIKSALETEAVIDTLSDTLSDLLDDLDITDLESSPNQVEPVEKLLDEEEPTKEAKVGTELAEDEASDKPSEFEDIERLLVEKLAKSNSLIADHLKDNKIKVKILTMSPDKDGAKELNDVESDSLSSIISRLIESDMQVEKQRESQINYQMNYYNLNSIKYDELNQNDQITATESNNDDDSLIVF